MESVSSTKEEKGERISPSRHCRKKQASPVNLFGKVAQVKCNQPVSLDRRGGEEKRFLVTAGRITAVQRLWEGTQRM